MVATPVEAVDASEHYATKAELGEIKAILPHLATKADLAAFQVATREDMAAFQTAVKEDMATFQTAVKEDITGLQAGFATLREDMAILQANIQTSIETGIAAAKSDMERGLRNTIFILVGVMMAGYATLIGALIVAILATAG